MRSINGRAARAASELRAGCLSAAPLVSNPELVMRKSCDQDRGGHLACEAIDSGLLVAARTRE